MTSGNGNNAPPVTGNVPQNGKSKTPRSVVTPQVLTHLIEGFVIQEGAEPFPVEHPSFSVDNLRRPRRQSGCESPKAASKIEDFPSRALKAQPEVGQQEPMLTCELCGRVDFAYVFRRSKRFCSRVCAKRYNVGCTKRLGLFPNRNSTLENLTKHQRLNGDHRSLGLDSKKKTGVSVQKPAAGSLSSGRSEDDPRRFSDAFDGPPSPASAGAATQRAHTGLDGNRYDLPFFSQGVLPGDPGKWDVENVYMFIGSLPGCSGIAEEFRSQEIDGQALLLLKEDHLMGTMNIKLGPALKIFAQISMLKDT